MSPLKTLALAAIMITASAPAFAAGACKEYVTVTPDIPGTPAQYTAPAGTPNSHGYSGIPGQFGCPIKAAYGTCVDANRSLVDPVGGNSLTAAAVPGQDVPDITEHRNGFNSPIAIPRLGIEQGFNPWPGNAGALQPGAC